MDSTHPMDPSDEIKRIEGLPKCSLLARIFLSEEKPGFSNHGSHKTAAAVVSDFGRGCFCCGGGDGDTLLRCQWWRRWGSKRSTSWENCRQWKRWEKHNDHQWDIVLVLVTKIAYIACPPFPSPPYMVESPVNRGSSWSATLRMVLSSMAIGSI